MGAQWSQRNMNEYQKRQQVEKQKQHIENEYIKAHALINKKIIKLNMLNKWQKKQEVI